jgi:hypothetical protein
MSTGGEVVAIIFVDAEVELSAMLNDSLIQGREQYVVFVV